MKWVLIILGAIIAIVGLVAIIGALLPRNHVASSTITLRRPADSVWAVVRDLAGAPSWWADVKKSVRLPDQDGRERWQQTMGNGFDVPLEVMESRPPSRLVTRIASPPGAVFGGTWTYEIAAAAGASRITVTEDGWVANPIFRFMSHVVFGVHGTQDGYLKALGKRFGEAVEPQHVR